MTPFFIQNEDWKENDVVLVKTLSFGTKKVVISWLFDDDLRTREQEIEEKETTNSAPKIDARLDLIFESVQCWMLQTKLAPHLLIPFYLSQSFQGYFYVKIDIWICVEFHRPYPT